MPLINSDATAHGWKYYDSCRCGSYRVEYRNDAIPAYALYIFPAQGLFVVKYKGSSTKIPPTQLAKLPESLQKLADESNH